jgi:hypothetical protein
MAKYIKNTNFLGRSELMAKNARKANALSKPNGYIYLAKLNGFDNIFKIGVSCNVNRRITDLDAASPFGVSLVESFFFQNVYNIEECLHDSYAPNLIRREWFNLDKQEIENIRFDLSQFSKQKLYLKPR